MTELFDVGMRIKDAFFDRQMVRDRLSAACAEPLSRAGAAASGEEGVVGGGTGHLSNPGGQDNGTTSLSRSYLGAI